MKIPLIPIPRVLHIGTLDPANVGLNSGVTSQEGHCLSVSVCPEAWRQIARLGGYPLHQLQNEEGLFLDALAVMDDETLWADIKDWSRKEGLVADGERWKAWRWDGEDETWSYSLHETREEALEEIDFDPEDDEEEPEGPDGEPCVAAVIVPVGTERLKDLTGFALGGFPEDFMVMAWAEHALPALLGQPVDGLWWDQDYDPDILSAPRGAIFPARVGAWDSSPISWAMVDDEEELADFPHTEWVNVTGAPEPSP